jgi:anti-anti-sigma factor
MPPPYRHLEVEHRDDVWCVRLRNRRLDEQELAEMTGEIVGLVKAEGCRKLALSLGPEPPQFLYSVFLARLVSLQRLLRENAGALVLCELRPEVYRIFEACKLDGQFRFARTFADACNVMNPPAK